MLDNINLETLIKRCAAFRKVYARVSAPELKAYGLSPSEVDILIFLANNPNINTAKEMGHFLQVSKGLVARSLESLITRGFLRTAMDERDHRRQHIFLEEEAYKVIAILAKRRQEVGTLILQGISQEQMQMVVETFDIMNANIMKILEEETNENVE